jgi:hypothetical protein
MQVFNDKTAPYQLPFEAYGIHVRVCTNDPELLDEIQPVLPPGWDRRPRSAAQHRIGLLAEEHDVYSIYHDTVCVHDAPGREMALMMMHMQLEGYVALNSPDFVFIHAGVVGIGGRAVVLPALSFSGKTTLVAALVQAGATYYSDEFAVLDEAGLVHPYARRLSLRVDGAPAVPHAIEDLGGVAGAEPLPVGIVAATRYVPGAEWDPQALSLGAGALAVFEHAVPARERPEQALRVIKKALNSAVIYQGERGEADELARVLVGTLRAAA